MKRPHPNRPYAAAAAALLVSVSLSGCRGQQTALSNPFLAPDRVPPPSTRMVPPGTAQPYYPGDPIPPTQSSTTPTPSADAFLASDVDSDYDTPAHTIVASGESPIAIPGDADDLRFTLPPLPTVAEAAPQPPTPPSAVAAVPGPSSASTPTVMPAVYNDADAYQVTPADPVVADNGPWRPPQIPPSTAAQSVAQNSHPMAAQPMMPQPMAAQPTVRPPTVPAAFQPSLTSLPPPPVAPVGAAAVPTMPVQLRAVPSPPLEVATSAAPRIRFADPNAPLARPGGAVSNSVDQAAYLASGPAGVPQTVPVTELPPGATYWLGNAPNVAAGPQTGSSVSPDGFRPRGSTW